MNLNLKKKIRYGHALRGPPPSPPSMVYGPGCPPLLWDGVWVPSSPCGVVVGVLGFWVWVLGFGSWVKKYKASSGLREDLGCRFVRVDSLCLV